MMILMMVMMESNDDDDDDQWIPSYHHSICLFHCDSIHWPFIQMMGGSECGEGDDVDDCWW